MIGFIEMAILASIVTMTCLLPSTGVIWQRYGRFAVGSLALLIVISCIVLECVRSVRRQWSTA